MVSNTQIKTNTNLVVGQVSVLDKFLNERFS